MDQHIIDAGEDFPSNMLDESLTQPYTQEQNFSDQHLEKKRTLSMTSACAVGSEPVEEEADCWGLLRRKGSCDISISKFL